MTQILLGLILLVLIGYCISWWIVAVVLGFGAIAFVNVLLEG